jgi:hypothetical protein
VADEIAREFQLIGFVRIFSGGELLFDQDRQCNSLVEKNLHGQRLPPATVLRCDAGCGCFPAVYHLVQQECPSFNAASAMASRTRRFATIGRPVCGKRQPCARLVTQRLPSGMASSRGNRPRVGSLTGTVSSIKGTRLSAGSGNRLGALRSCHDRQY